VIEMMKNLKYLFLAISILHSSNLFADDTIFINGFEDVPMMPKLSQANNSGIAFDTQFGRIVETYLESEYNVNFIDVTKYYSETLPQLGWKKISINDKKLTFSREGEILEISLTENEKPILIRISVHD
jgi:hypothetical protein